MTTKQLKSLARRQGTPVVVIDHDQIRKNYAEFKKHLPKVQAYYAVKANAEPAIVRTLYKAGASFDVASLPEFMLVYENIKRLPAKQQQDFIWDKIIYANPTKPKDTLKALAQVLQDKYVYGGLSGALQTDFPTSVANIAGNPPKAAIVYEGDFVEGTLVSTSHSTGLPSAAMRRASNPRRRFWWMSHGKSRRPWACRPHT